MKKIFLAICFAVLSLGSFAEDKIYEAKAEARGYNEDGVPIVLTVKATKKDGKVVIKDIVCLLYTSPSPRDRSVTRMPSSA